MSDFDEWNEGVFEVLSVDWGNQGPNSEKAVIVVLRGEDGVEFSVANNWERGQQQRYDDAKTLIGKSIRYSTWRKEIYARNWFKELELIGAKHDSTGVKELVKELSEKNYGKMSPKMKELLSLSNDSEDDSDDILPF